jgi:hypothetical protein
VRHRQRRLTSADNYGRKLKPTAKKTRKTRQKTKKHLKTHEKKDMQKLQINEEIMAVAALLALGMLAIIPGMIAGSVLTKPAIQHHNIGAQASAAYCGYRSGWFSDLWGWGSCMYDLWIPDLTLTFTGLVATSKTLIDIGNTVGSWRLVYKGLRLLRFTGWGFIVAVA